MRPSRLAAAAVLALLYIGVALVAPLATPLQALRGQRGQGELAALPDRVAAPFAAVRDAAGRGRRLYFPKTSTAADPIASAVALLAAETAGSPLEFAAPVVRRSPSGTHVRFEPRAFGFPIHGAEAVVSFDHHGTPALLALDLGADAMPSDAMPPPSIATATAVARARAAVGAQESYATPDVRTLYRARDGRVALEHRVRFASATPAGDWEVWIDAATGDVHEITDRTLHAAPRRTSDTGQARVFRPDPVLVLGDPALTDGQDDDSAVPEAAYTTVPLLDLAPPQQGWYRLRGAWVEVRDWEAPWIAADSALVPAFERSRSHPGFEDAMAYYHLDAVQRWYQALGFADANHRAQVIDPHGLNGQDNSKFVPSVHRIAMGEGGVDDAEDAAVLVHEYGHATQYDIVPTWGTGGHTGAMGEGFGDYLANSYAWSHFPQRVRDWNGVFQWDGHNEFWNGRRVLDTTMHYPEHATGAVHRAGTLWCSALTDALYTLGDRRVMDTLVLDHHYALTGSATMADAANAILASDVAIYGGAHLERLVEVFGRWGLVDAAAWQPIAIQHAPLDVAARDETPPRIEARVVSQQGAVTAVTAYVRTGADSFVPITLEPTGIDLWTAAIVLPAGNRVDVEYWLEARDASGSVARCPAAGAAAPFRAEFGLYADRCEADAGWTLGAPGDAAITGRWTRAVPIGTAAQAATDHTSTGSACFVTANGTAGAPASDADVDGGATTLVSPIWDLRGAGRATLSYWRWYSNDLGTLPPDDVFVVEVSNDAGLTWVEVERTAMAALEWRRVEIDLVAALGAPDRVRARFVASDYGAGSVVEAGVDDVLLQVEFATDAAADRAPLGRLDVPNPWRAGMPIRIALARAGAARLEIFDARGRAVRRVWNGPLGAGPQAFVWDGRDARGARVARGVYVVRLQSAGAVMTRKMAFVAD